MNSAHFYELTHVAGLGGLIETGTIEWTPHRKFEGVFLKHIITAEQTGGMLSSHVVRLDSFSELGNHIHEGQVEIHEVVSGTGFCLINGVECEYTPGVTAVIPADTPHSVKAGNGGLCFMAKFSPALL